MIQQDWDAALKEADLAIAEEPDNFISYSWKAKVLQMAGDDAGVVQVSLEAFQRPPNASRDLEKKFRQLMALKLFKPVDETVSQAIRDGEFGKWLRSDEIFTVPRNPERYPKTNAILVAQTLEHRDKLVSDPNDQDARREFFGACRVLGPDCPPFFPERRKYYPEMSCDVAISAFDRVYPKFAELTLPVFGHETIQEFFRNDPKKAAAYAMSMYMGDALVIEDGNEPDHAYKLIVNDRMFECFSNGEFYHLMSDVDPEDKRMANEVLYHPELRRNLLDLAHAALN